MSGFYPGCKARPLAQSINERIDNLMVSINNVAQAVQGLDITIRNSLAKVSEVVASKNKEIDELKARIMQLEKGDEDKQSEIDRLALEINKQSDTIGNFVKGL